MHYNLKTIKEKVSYILEKYSKCRNSDLLLIAYYMKKIHNVETILEWANRSTELKVSAETIRRIRQKLNEEGKFLPTDEKVLKQRGLLEKKFKDKFSNKWDW